ncbi:MAG: lysine--tRNA ligase [Gemmatimonadota bacterium]
MSGGGRRSERCPECGKVAGALREGICLACWYTSPERPKPVRDRYAKLEQLRERGIEPYAYGFERSHELAEARTAFEAAESVEEAGSIRVRVAGRILSHRDLGGSAFSHLGDRSGRLQVYFKRDLLDERGNHLLELLDLGDWIGVAGSLFRTRTGEVTARAEELTLLAKTLRPLPFGKEEVSESGERIVHGGFSNVESRYRRRYADLAVNPEVRELFLLRARLVSALRSYLDGRGFVEVETPVLQPMYGGAFARPFTTRHEALDTKLYLRIADELYLKRLIVGNLDRVYEIGKDFRNEGIDRTHNPEFTMLELYQALADYEGMMELAEEMVTEVLAEVCGGLELEYEGRRLDFSRPWARISFTEGLRRHAGLDPAEATVAELREAARALGRPDAEQLTRPRLLDLLFAARVEPALGDPTIVYDYPVEMSPLAKPKRGDPALAERFEMLAGGQEILNAFSELNDPLDQWTRFVEQGRQREAGDLEAQRLDEDYVRALEYGLPPTGGLGLGVDRLVMLASGRPSIREVVLFPILRPDEGR